MSKLAGYIERWHKGLELAPITALLPVSLGDGEARIELTSDRRQCDLEDKEGRLVARMTLVCAMRQPEQLPSKRR